MKKKILFLIILIMLCIPFKIYASSILVDLECPSSAKASSEVSCTASVTPSGMELRGIQANVNVVNGIYQGLDTESNWTEYTNSLDGFSLNLKSSSTSKTIIGKLKFKMPTSGELKVSLINVRAANSHYESIEGNLSSKSIKVSSNVNTLKSLSITGGTLSSEFNSDITNYNAISEESNITISATSDDPNSIIKGLGNKTLKYGINKFEIVVTSESGEDRVYTLNVNRIDNRSKDNTLSNIKVSSGSLSFNRNQTKYDIEVENNVSSLKIDAVLNNNKASFVEGFGPGTVKLVNGKNVIELKIKAENEDIGVYTLNITRKSVSSNNSATNDNKEEKKSSNNNLKDIKLSEGNIEFNKDVLEYNISILYGINKIDVIPELEDSKAKYEIKGNNNLIVGENTIIISVIAEDGTIKEYKINVTKKEREEILSSNSKLKSLTIAGYDLKFNSDKFIYELDIKRESKLNITYTTDDSNSGVLINGNEDLKNGSAIKITVTAEDGTKSEYVINIHKNNLKNIVIICVIFILFIILLILFIFLIILKKKNDEEEKNYNNNNLVI